MPTPPPLNAAVRHYRPGNPGGQMAGVLDLGATVAHFTAWRGVLYLEPGPFLGSAQGDWLVGMRAYRVTNWATFRQANPQGPCGRDAVRWVAIRNTPSTDPAKPVPDSIDVALLSETDIKAFRPDNPTLCLFSTFRDMNPVAEKPAKRAVAKSRGKRKPTVRRGKRRAHRSH